jgi:hypothetical protein
MTKDADYPLEPPGAESLPMLEAVDPFIDDPLEAKFCQAYLEAGFVLAVAAKECGLTPAEAGKRYLTRSGVRAWLKARIVAAGVDPMLSLVRIAQIASGDLADLEDVLDGKMSLKEARAAGVNTRLVKKMKKTRHVGKDGDETQSVELELHDQLKANEAIVKLAAEQSAPRPDAFDGRSRYVTQEPLRRLPVEVPPPPADLAPGVPTPTAGFSQAVCVVPADPETRPEEVMPAAQEREGGVI